MGFRSCFVAYDGSRIFCSLPLPLSKWAHHSALDAHLSNMDIDLAHHPFPESLRVGIKLFTLLFCVFRAVWCWTIVTDLPLQAFFGTCRTTTDKMDSVWFHNCDPSEFCDNFAVPINSVALGSKHHGIALSAHYGFRHCFCQPPYANFHRHFDPALPVVDIDIFINRSLVYGALIVTVIGLYMIVVGVAGA